MSNPKHTFDSHRCDAMPEGFSIRRYYPNGRVYQWPKPGGWVLACAEWDSDWDHMYLNPFTPMERQHVKFCPWCGEHLRGDAE